MTIEDDVTRLLKDWRQGNLEALERLVPVVYDELRKVARWQLRREAAGHSLEQGTEKATDHDV